MATGGKAIARGRAASGTSRSSAAGSTLLLVGDAYFLEGEYD